MHSLDDLKIARAELSLKAGQNTMAVRHLICELATHHECLVKVEFADGEDYEIDGRGILEHGHPEA